MAWGRDLPSAFEGQRRLLLVRPSPEMTAALCTPRPEHRGRSVMAAPSPSEINGVGFRFPLSGSLRASGNALSLPRGEEGGCAVFSEPLHLLPEGTLSQGHSRGPVEAWGGGGQPDPVFSFPGTCPPTPAHTEDEGI